MSAESTVQIRSLHSASYGTRQGENKGFPVNDVLNMEGLRGGTALGNS